MTPSGQPGLDHIIYTFNASLRGKWNERNRRVTRKLKCHLPTRNNSAGRSPWRA